MADKKRRQLNIRITDDVYERLEVISKQTKVSRSAYIRNIVNGLILQPIPTKEMLEIIGQLRRIGNNINQISIVANKTGNIDVVLYKENYKDLQQQITEIKHLVSKPLIVQDSLCR